MNRRRKRACVAAGALAIAWSHVAACPVQGAIIVSSAYREVVSAATYAAPDSDSTTALGSFISSVSSTGDGAGGTIFSEAHQNGVADPLGMTIYCLGTAHGTATATGDDGFSVLGRSLYEVFFEVDQTGDYHLEAIIHWLGDAPPFGGSATVELFDIDASLIIDEITRDPSNPGTSTLSSSPLLTAGTAYRLRAFAQVDGGFATGGAYGVNADWNFFLESPNVVVAIVPEPSMLGLVTAAGIAVAIVIQRRRAKQP